MQSNNPLNPKSYDGFLDSRTHEGGHKGNCQDHWQDSKNVLIKLSLAWRMCHASGCFYNIISTSLNPKSHEQARGNQYTGTVL